MEDGVYLGLPHADYLAVPDRLGSTDFTKLYARGAGWWWTSRHNPHYAPKATDAQVFGTALHTLMLEGRAEYEKRFAVMPNQRDYPNLLRSATELHGALEAADAPGLKAKTPKAELVQLARAYLPDRHVWDDIVERWGRSARDKLHLESGDAFALEAMYAAALADPDMAEVCDAHGGVKLSEVSIFYTNAAGLKCRFRLDLLLPTANVDLKAVAVWGSNTFAQTVARRIADEHLNVQLAMSHEARLAMYQLIKAGKLFAPIDGEPVQMCATSSPAFHWLCRFPGEAPLAGPQGPGWCWLWLFYQKPESGAAPSLLPLRVLWGDDLHRSGWRKLRTAEATYAANVARFGLDKPWTNVSGIHDTHHRASNRVDVREWDTPQQLPGEHEAMQWRK